MNKVIYFLLIVVMIIPLFGCEREDKDEIERIQKAINEPYQQSE